MTNKNTYIAALQKQLDNLDAQIKRMDAVMNTKRAEARAEYAVRKKHLQDKRAELVQNMDDLSNASENAWEDLKSGTDNAWHEVKTAFKQASSHFS